MKPVQKLYQNRPPPIQPFQATKKRKSAWETKFQKEYPTVKWNPKSISVKFLIPLDKVKELFEDKPKMIKYIYDKIEIETRASRVGNEEVVC